MNSAGQCWSDAWNRCEFCFRCVFDAFSSAEMAQERLQFLRTETFHGLQRVGEARPASTLTMEGVHKPMGFVTGVDQHSAAPVEHQRFVFGPEDGLLALGQGRKREAIFPSVFFKRLTDGAEVCFAAIDEQQIRPFFLTLCPANNNLFHHA